MPNIKKFINVFFTCSIAFVVVTGIGLMITFDHKEAQRQQEGLVIAQPAPQTEVLYWKTIDVKVTSVKIEYAFKGSYVVAATVRSDEYNLEKVITLRSNEPYCYDMAQGKIKPGDTVKATLNSWKAGDTVTRREISTLTY